MFDVSYFLVIVCDSPISHSSFEAAGIDSVFVLGGIHAEELGLIPTGTSVGGIVITDDDDDDKQETGCIAKQDLDKKLQLFFKEKGIFPTHVIPSLSLQSE